MAKKALSILKRITGGKVMYVLYSMLPRMPRLRRLRSTTRWSSLLLDMRPWAWHRSFVCYARYHQSQIHGGIRGIIIHFAIKGKTYAPLDNGYAPETS